MFNHLALLCFYAICWTALTLIIIKIVIRTDIALQLFRQAVTFQLYSAILFYLLIVLIYYLVIYYNSFNEKLMRESALYRSVKDTELQLLKSQLHPHFLFNSLNSMNALLITNVEGAQNMLLKLSEFLRKSLDEKANTLVQLGEELDFGKLYLDIEKIRFGDRLMIVEQIDPASLKATLPHMLLQPLYENVIKHALSQMIGSTIITIQSSIMDDFLHLTISNNFENNSGSLSKAGLGLKNVQKRLALHYGRKDCFQLNVKENNFSVKLIIPQICKA